MMRARRLQQRGFTLIELIMVIILMGIIGSMVAVFMKSPIDAYFDTARRAALSDVADTAVRRMARDIRKALPNSISASSTATTQCLEFIPTKIGGRYRVDVDTTVAGAQADNILNFGSADTKFNMLGRSADLPAEQQILVNDYVVVYNLGISGADAYAGSNRSLISAVDAVTGSTGHGDETRLTIASTTFPLASGSNRFHVVPGGEQVVAYVCSAGNLSRTVRTFAQSACPSGGPVLAGNVSACSFVYNGSDLQRNAMVQIMLNLTSNGETVSLYHQVNVNNTP